MDIYSSTDYKGCLYDSLLYRKSVYGSRYTFQKMATACRVQKTYLSKVLNSDGHLNEDQLFAACDYLGFDDKEREYVFLLHARDRSINQNRIKVLESKIAKIHKDQCETSGALEAEKVDARMESMHEYYLNPNMVLCHIFLAIDRYATDTTKLACALELDQNYCLQLIEKLVDLKLINHDGEKFIIVKDSLHLDIGSPLYQPYRQLQRLKALEQLNKPPSDESYNFSVTFTADENTRLAIKKRFLVFLTDIETIAKSSPDEKVYQMNFDLFPWN